MITYRKADIHDLELLIEARCAFLKALRSPGGDAGKDVDHETEKEIESRREAIRVYHECAFKEDRIVGFLAYDEKEDAAKKLIGFGEACLYEVIPGFVNPNGRRAYIMNIYTEPAYRGNGIATKIVDMLVNECRERSVHQITLNSSAMGRHVYEAYGFMPMSENDMILKI